MRQATATVAADATQTRVCVRSLLRVDQRDKVLERRWTRRGRDGVGRNGEIFQEIALFDRVTAGGVGRRRRFGIEERIIGVETHRPIDRSDRSARVVRHDDRSETSNVGEMFGRAREESVGLDNRRLFSYAE